jgi:hypothetical protein
MPDRFRALDALIRDAEAAAAKAAADAAVVLARLNKGAPERRRSLSAQRRPIRPSIHGSRHQIRAAAVALAMVAIAVGLCWFWG